MSQKQDWPLFKSIIHSTIYFSFDQLKLGQSPVEWGEIPFVHPFVHHPQLALRPLKLALRPCWLALGHCWLALRPHQLALRPLLRALGPLQLASQSFQLALQSLQLAVQPCQLVLHAGGVRGPPSRAEG